jgi:spermidine synthase
MTSLFVEQQANGTAFYINGELQFHSADEAIYHEYLTIPAIALAAKRFPDQPLRVLICGGGDGLAARDILRFPQVSHIDLVDYSQEVIDLAKDIFAPFNQNSLINPKVNLHVHEAFAFLSNITEKIENNHQQREDYAYHVIICDFTYPTTVAETQIYSQEWFALLKQVLVPSGLIAVNSVSPDHNTLAFWCIYKSMQSTGLIAKPMQLMIPSFINHDYGNWGFFLASETNITRLELASLDLPNNLCELNLDKLMNVFLLDRTIVKAQNLAISHHQGSSQLFFYLLNHRNISISNDENELDDIDKKVDFLSLEDNQPSLVTISETETIPSWFMSGDPLNLDNLAKAWLEQIEANPDEMIIPAQHYSQTPEVSQEWLGRATQLLNQIDFSRLIAKLLERSQELPHEIATDLRELQTKFLKFQQLQQSRQVEQIPSQESFQGIYDHSETSPSFSLTTAKVIAIVSLTLLVANLAAPDAVFAKGSTSSFARTGSTGNGSGGLEFLGLMMTVGGVIWLINLASDNKK